MKFEWDEKKNQTNANKHGIDFIDAKEIFNSVRLTVTNNRKDYGEPRKISIGTIGLHVCVVVYTARKGVIRIISARKANQKERRKYYELIERTKTEEN